MGIIMSHNSWSFLKPRTFWGRLLHFTSKCQSYNIKEQYENFGVRAFDLVIKLSKKGKGPMVLCNRRDFWWDLSFKYNSEGLEDDLEYLNSKGDAVVRVQSGVGMLRYETEETKQWFIDYCEHLENTFKNIRFIGGNPGYTCYKYYHFHSMNVKFVDKFTFFLWPKLTAPFINKRIKGDDNVVVDYVQYLKKKG